MQAEPASFPTAADAENLKLKRVGPQTAAGLWITSLPWPPSPPRALALAGQPTYVAPLGEWPNRETAIPRRLLLVADGQNQAPDTVALTQQVSAPAQPPTAEMECFAESQEPTYMWARHLARIRFGNKSIGFALGLRVAGEVHWWEGCGLVTLEDAPFCRVIHMAGSIPRQLTDHASMAAHPGYTNPLLHKHNWLSGHLVLRLYANGVCEVFARHINSRFFDDGADLRDVAPVIGIVGPGGSELPAELAGTWDGSHEAIELGGVPFDMTEAALLATPEQPGQWQAADGFAVWQPYMGVDMYGGICPKKLTGDPWVFHAEDGVFPRGMARTVRFSFSLSDRSPRIARYLAPYWWYGATAELTPKPYLPVSNTYDTTLDACSDWLLKARVPTGFEAGSVARHVAKAPPTADTDTRNEPGWEGEIPYGQFLLAYRTGKENDYLGAMRSAYHFTDVAVDHAAKLVRMHGFPPVAYAQPMNRVLGTLAAYLETGDPYLLETAEAVTESAYRLHQNSWPRTAVGRDACFARGATMLYRYFNNLHFLKMAREGARSVALSQRKDGSFGDQGGGAGIHQWGAYITKPWMGLLATACVLDYLELFPEEETLQRCVLKFGDWLMQVRWQRNGFTGWSYQHNFNGKSTFHSFQTNTQAELPDAGRWHQDNLARLMGYCTLQTGNGAYLDAWAESYAAGDLAASDHSVSAALQFLPWIQAHLWQARPTNEGIAIRPLHFGPRTPREASIQTAQGAMEVAWSEDGRIVAPDRVTVEGRVEKTESGT